MSESVIVEVASSEPISENLRRVTLTGPALAGWRSTGAPDEFVHVHLPGAEPAEGWSDDHDNARHYTVRRWDPDVPALVIDVVTHGHGTGAAWAQQAQPGEVVAVSEPHGYYGPPEGTTRRLLVADTTGLPAVARILEEAGPAESFEVVVELMTMNDAIPLPSAAQVTLSWRISGNGRTPSGLLAVMEGMATPPEDTYVWVACESAESRRVRTFIRSHWPRHHTAYRVVGYWHLDQEEQLRKWNALTADQQDRYTQIWDESRPDEVNWIELEPYLQELGL